MQKNNPNGPAWPAPPGLDGRAWQDFYDAYLGESCPRLRQEGLLPGVGLFLTQPLGGGVGLESLAEGLARAHFAREGRGRSFDQSYLSRCCPPPGAPESQWRAFFQSPQRQARFYNRFRGVFHMDLSAWLQNPQAPELGVLCRYLQQGAGEVACLFSVRAETPEAADGLFARLSLALPLRRADLLPPRPRLLARLTQLYLAGMGVGVTAGALALVVEYAEALAGCAGFCHMDSIPGLAKNLAAGREAGRDTLTRRDLKRLAGVCLTGRPQPVRRIGF